MVYDRIRSLVESLAQGLVEREEAVRLALLAALSGESIVLLGPPGVGKTAVARRAAAALCDTVAFERALDGFTTADDLYGPARTEPSPEGRLRATDGYLPKATVVTLENIWNGSPSIRDALLPVVSDRRFRNGGAVEEVPWRFLVGTTDYLPPLAEVSRPFWERFLLRVALSPLETAESFRQLLLSPHDFPAAPDVGITPSEWESWQEQINTVELTEEVVQLIVRVREVLDEANEKRRNDGAEEIYVSDRRWVELTRLLKASAFFHGRKRVDPLDCLLLRHGLWERPEQIEEVNELIRVAISQYAASDRFDTRKLLLEFRRLADEIDNQRIDYQEEDVRELERYRGEYYVVDEFIEDFTSLIWIEDFESLLADAPKRVELFFYDENEQLSHTDIFSVLRTGEGSVEINGEIFPLRGTDVRRSVAERRKLTPNEAKHFGERLEELKSTCRRKIEEIESLRSAGESESREHLFVKREYAALLLDSLSESVENLMALETDIRALEVEAFGES
ncbi:MAG: AAA family ATPase [Alkalispirochaetaceae bacterium]